MTTLMCPLCSQSKFDTLEALRIRLVTAATQNIMCPVCNEALLGLDKFTIHLFGHTLIPPKPEPVAAPLPEKEHILDDSLCTVNMEDLSFLTSWENCSKPSPSEATSKVTSPCTDFSRTEANFVEISPPTIAVNNVPYNLNMNQPSIECCQRYDFQNVSERRNVVEDPREQLNSPLKEPDCQLPAKQNDLTPQLPLNDPLLPPTLVFNATLLEGPSNVTGILLHPVNYLTNDEISSDASTTSRQNSHNENTAEPTSPDSVHQESSSESRELSEYMSDLLRQKLAAESDLLSEKIDTVKCDNCSTELNSLHNLDAHKEIVHGRQQSYDLFICKICGREFKMRGSLLVHTRVAHGGFGVEATGEVTGQEPRNFHCTLCTKSFKKEQHLAQHMKTHDGKQWQCETCSKYFTTKYFLKKHQRLHTGEMPYSCETCKKTFTFQQSYHKHLLYHSADKPHECQECGRSFKELSTLHNHQRIHSGEKPFACETCGKCFRQRVSYIVHQRIHTGVLPYQCTACKKKFRYKVSQRSHKCTVQPPGVVVRQPGDLIQRIMEQRQNILKCIE